MTIASATDVFFDQLKDLRSALQQVPATLPDLADWANQEKLRAIFEHHLQETDRHLREVEAIFEAHGREAGDDVCKAIAGLIEGGNQHIKAAGDAIVRDLLLIAHTNRIFHYLIAAAEFTQGIAKNCGLCLEADVAAEVLGFERDCTKRLAETGAVAYGVELGVAP